MLPSATSSSIVGARLIHSLSRCDSTRQPSASASAVGSSDVGDTIGDLVEGRVAVDLVERRLEQRVLVARVARDDLRRWDDPDAAALTAAGVDVTRVLDGHLGVDRVHAADVLMVQTVARADED